MKKKIGDIYYNPYAGDLWFLNKIWDNSENKDVWTLNLIHDDYREQLKDVEGFVRIGNIYDMINEKQELIDYLKDLIENKYTNGKVVWFDSEYAKTYGELCNMAGYKANRLALVPLSEIEKFLSKIEKE